LGGTELFFGQHTAIRADYVTNLEGRSYGLVSFMVAFFAGGE
jgi:hypothetical protein